jgi:hypothetical protein
MGVDFLLPSMQTRVPVARFLLTGKKPNTFSYEERGWEFFKHERTLDGE